MGRPAKKDPEKYCPQCGALMKRRRFGERLEDMTRFLSRKYCSEACMAAAYVKDAPQKKTFHQRARRLLGNCCAICGAAQNLHAHHCDGNPQNNLPDNIQTLCGSCHLIHHHHVRRVGLTVPGPMTSRLPYLGRARVECKPSKPSATP